MTAQIIDGKAVAARLRADIARQVLQRQSAGARAPALAVVLVGEDPASHVYVRNKILACEQAGITSIEHRRDAALPDADLLALVAELNADPAVDGILVQLPLPRHIDSSKVIAAISPEKDVDGFSPVNAGRIATGEATIEDVGWELFRLLLDVASGRKTWAEQWKLHNALTLFNPAPIT